MRHVDDAWRHAGISTIAHVVFDPVEPQTAKQEPSQTLVSPVQQVNHLVEEFFGGEFGSPNLFRVTIEKRQVISPCRRKNLCGSLERTMGTSNCGNNIVKRLA